MALIVLGAAALVVVGLLVLDLVVMRGQDRYDGVPPTSGGSAEGPREPGELVWRRAEVPGLVRAGAVFSAVLGLLYFPATLAPVILTALAFQAQPLLTDGWVALVAVVVAGLSMSVALKALRTSHLLIRLTDDTALLLRNTLLYQAAWTIFVLLLLLVADVPGGLVGLVVWAYVGTLLGGALLVGFAGRAALAFVARTHATPAADD